MAKRLNKIKEHYCYDPILSIGYFKDEDVCSSDFLQLYVSLKEEEHDIELLSELRHVSYMYRLSKGIDNTDEDIADILLSAYKKYRKKRLKELEDKSKQ
jgi:hypothetical protein